MKKLLIICVGAVIWLGCPEPSEPATLEVRAPGGIGTLGNGDIYTCIQDAIDDANDGDELIIHDGVYTETLTITGKGLTLTGEDESTVIVEANGTGPVDGDNVFTINADGKDITIQNMTIRNGDYGIRSSAGNVNVLHCTMYYNGWDGTGLPDPETATMQEFVDFWNTSGHVTDGGAMRIENSAASEIAHCTIYDNDRGIRFQNGDNGNIHNNVSHDNIESGIYLAAPSYSGATGCTNTDVNDNECYGNMNNGILSIGGHTNTIRNNDVYDNWTSGIAADYPSEITIQGNTINNNNVYGFTGEGTQGENHGGIFMSGSTGVASRTFTAEILNNTISNNNSGTGTDAEGIRITSSVYSDGIDIEDNTFINHDIDILVLGQAATITVNGNKLDGGSIGVQNDDTSATLDAEYNWWGDASGPYNADTNPDALGDEVSNYVDYEPWYASESMLNPVVVKIGITEDIRAVSETIQGGVDAAHEGDTIEADPCTYDESVTINVDSLTIIGIEGSLPKITGGVTLPGVTGLTLENFVITGDGGSNSVIRMTGAVTDLTLDNCVLDGENVAGRLGLSGGRLEGDVTITNCEFKNILGWAVLDSRSGSGGDGSAMGTVTFANNNIHHCNGSIVFRGLSSDRTDAVNAYGNTWSNIGGNNAETGQHWAALEINRTVDANVYDNDVNGVSEGEWGEGQALQLWDIDTLDVHDNTLTNNFQGIYVHGSDPVSSDPLAVPGGSIYCNNISDNNDYGISVDPTATGGPLDAENNWWGDVNGPSGEGPGGGDTVSTNVDFVPWLLSTDCNDGSGEVLLDFVVDDDWEGLPMYTRVFASPTAYYIGINAFDTIQDAIDEVSDGNSISVADGNYAPFTVDGKTNLTIVAGSNPVVQGVQSVTTAYGARDCVVFVKDSVNVVLNQLDIRGVGLGIINAKNYGVIWENSSGGIEDCTVDPNTIDDMSSTAIGIWDGSVLTVQGCLLERFGRIGILVYNGTTAEILENEIIGQVYAGEGQVNYGIEVEGLYASDDPDTASSATIKRNIIYNCDNTFSPEPSWASSAIYVNGWMFYGPEADSTITVVDNDIYDNYNAIYVVNSPSSRATLNNIYDNRTTGVESVAALDSSTAVFDAEYNWWGDISGPNDPCGTDETDGVTCYDVSAMSNTDGLGDAVSENVSYCAWLIVPACTSTAPCLAGDLNGDGCVDWRDFAIFALNWLEGCE